MTLRCCWCCRPQPYEAPAANSPPAAVGQGSPRRLWRHVLLRYRRCCRRREPSSSLHRHPCPPAAGLSEFLLGGRWWWHHRGRPRCSYRR